MLRPEARAAEATRRRLVGLFERLEHALRRLLSHTDAGIFYAEAYRNELSVGCALHDAQRDAAVCVNLIALPTKLNNT